MLISYQNGQTSVVIRVKLRQDTTGAKPGNGITGLTNSSTGLVIGTIADNEASSTAYTSAGSTIDSIATLGTFATPTATHCNFKQVDSTNHPGVYELQLANARYAVSNAKSLLVSISGVSGMSDCDVCIPLQSVNPYDGVHGGMSALPNTACTTNASLLTSGSGTDQLSVSSGKVLLQATQSGVTIPTVTTLTGQLTAAQIATGVWQDATAGDFTTASSIGKSLYTSGVVPGASGGLFIAGTNAATTVNITGTLSTVTTVTNQLTAAAIATGVWQDATAGDFTTASSIGKSLYTSGNAPGAASGLALVGSNVGSATSVSGSVGSVTGLTNATIATTVWQDLLASSDFSTASSIGALLKADINAPIGNIPTNPYTGTPPTTAQIATAVWEDTTAGGDFGTAGSIGKLIVTTGLTIAGVSGVTFPATVASPTNITAGTITTVMNLTNAPTAGDFTATMKTSIGTAVAASAVASVTAGVTVATNNDKTGYSLTVSPPTAAAIATAIWTDTTSSDFTTGSSPGKVLVTQLGGTFTTTSSSVFSTAALANGPGGGGNVTVGGYAAGQDPATLVLDVLQSGHNTAGTIGHYIGAAGGGADPLLNNPTTYVPGQIGWDIAQTYANTSSVTVIYVSPVQPATGQVVIYAGSSYTLTSGRAIILSIAPGVQNLSSGVDHLELRWPGVTIRSTAINNAGLSNQSVTFEANATLTAAWTVYDGPFYVWAIMTDQTQNLLDATGRVTVQTVT